MRLLTLMEILLQYRQGFLVIVLHGEVVGIASPGSYGPGISITSYLFQSSSGMIK